MPAMICPKMSIEVVGGCGTTVDHFLAMAFDDSTIDDDLRRVLNAHEIVLGEEWPNI